MAITLEPAWLDTSFGDSEAMLARRDGRLFAVLSCLGDLHGTLLGHWYVEATFSTGVVNAGEIYPSLTAFEAHVAREIA